MTSHTDFWIRCFSSSVCECVCLPVYSDAHQSPLYSFQALLCPGRCKKCTAPGCLSLLCLTREDCITSVNPEPSLLGPLCDVSASEVTILSHLLTSRSGSLKSLWISSWNSFPSFASQVIIFPSKHSICEAFCLFLQKPFHGLKPFGWEECGDLVH